MGKCGKTLVFYPPDEKNCTFLIGSIPGQNKRKQTSLHIGEIKKRTEFKPISEKDRILDNLGTEACFSIYAYIYAPAHAQQLGVTDKSKYMNNLVLSL